MLISDLDYIVPMVAADGISYLQPNEIAHPCGLKAKYYFNDEYTFYDVTHQRKVFIDEKQLSNWQDITDDFKLPPGGLS